MYFHKEFFEDRTICYLEDQWKHISDCQAITSGTASFQPNVFKIADLENGKLKKETCMYCRA